MPTQRCGSRACVTLGWLMLLRECGRLQVCNSFLGFRKGVVCSSFAGRVNGPLLLALLEATGYVDLDCVYIFKEGAAIVGGIKPSGIGASMKQVEAKPLQDLWAGHADSNARLLESLREDPNAEWLWEHTVAEAALGRMSEPERLHIACLHRHSRFHQGTAAEICAF